jgi:hypothetical protein
LVLTGEGALEDWIAALYGIQQKAGAKKWKRQDAAAASF